MPLNSVLDIKEILNVIRTLPTLSNKIHAWFNSCLDSILQHLEECTEENVDLRSRPAVSTDAPSINEWMEAFTILTEGALNAPPPGEALNPEENREQGPQNAVSPNSVEIERLRRELTALRQMALNFLPPGEGIPQPVAIGRGEIPLEMYTLRIPAGLRAHLFR